MKEYIERDKLYGTESLLMSDIVKENPVAKYILEQVLFDIKETPAADVRENIHAKWLRKVDGSEFCYWYECSNCGCRPPRNQWGQEYDSNYCPDCGAEMIYS